MGDKSDNSPNDPWGQNDPSDQSSRNATIGSDSLGRSTDHTSQSDVSPGAVPTGTDSSSRYQSPSDVISPGWLLRLGLVIELALVAISLLAASVFDFYDHKKPLVRWFDGDRWFAELLLGALLALPILVVVMYGLPRIGTLEKFFEFVNRQLAPLFRKMSLPGIVALSIAAGAGEEVFFRWCILGGLDQFLTLPAAIILSSLVFGLAHMVNATYFLLTFVMGILLALIYLHVGPIASICCHAVYDLLAILQLKRKALTEQASSE